MRALNFCSGTITFHFEMTVTSSINLKTEAFCNPTQRNIFQDTWSNSNCPEMWGPLSLPCCSISSDLSTDSFNNFGLCFMCEPWQNQINSHKPFFEKPVKDQSIFKNIELLTKILFLQKTNIKVRLKKPLAAVF